MSLLPRVPALVLLSLLPLGAACAPDDDGAAASTATGDAALSASDGAMNALTDAERAEGWRLLFDGRTTEGWRGFRREDMPPGWEVADGELRRVEHSGDIITVEEYDDFELSLEWKVVPGGNSGIFFNVSEEAEEVWHTGPEMQVLDDERHRDGQDPLTAAGANYALHPAPRGVVRPAGEWNEARILVRGNHVEHSLNGQKIVEYELGSEDWERRVAESKFAELPRYGRESSGHISLQDHGDPGDRVAYRNIKLRVP